MPGLESGQADIEHMRKVADPDIDNENNPALHNQDVILVRRSGMATFSDNASLFLGPVGRFLGDVLNVIRIFN